MSIEDQLLTSQLHDIKSMEFGNSRDEIERAMHLLMIMKGSTHSDLIKAECARKIAEAKELIEKL